MKPHSTKTNEAQYHCLQAANFDSYCRELESWKSKRLLSIRPFTLLLNLQVPRVELTPRVGLTVRVRLTSRVVLTVRVRRKKSKLRARYVSH